MPTRIVLPASLALMALAAPALADLPAVKSEFVFTVNKALVERCSGDFDFNLALANASVEMNEGLARRDVIRALRSCERKYKQPRQQAFTFVALEALSRCENATCSPDLKEEIAEATFRASRKFTESYAIELLGSLKDACSITHDFDCVSTAVEEANARVSDANFPWLKVDNEGRIIGIGDEEYDVVASHAPKLPADKLAAGENALDAIVTGIEMAFPDGVPKETGEIIISEAADHLEGAGLKVDVAEISVPEFEAPWEVDVVAGMWRVSTDLGADACAWFADAAWDKELAEVTINSRLYRGGDASLLCTEDLNTVAMAAE